MAKYQLAPPVPRNLAPSSDKDIVPRRLNGLDGLVRFPANKQQIQLGTLRLAWTFGDWYIISVKRLCDASGDMVCLAPDVHGWWDLICDDANCPERSKDLRDFAPCTLLFQAWSEPPTFRGDGLFAGVRHPPLGVAPLREKF